jgi:hypothetical protein
VDHPRITPGNPKANGLAERFVGTLKGVTAKIGADPEMDESDWETVVLNFLAAYRFTRQTSTRYSPFELLFARQPAFPGQLKERFAEALDFDGSTEHMALLVDEMAERAALLLRDTPLCMANLEIAQHRDTLTYARSRDRTYLPRLRRYAVGDLVYLTRTNKQATQPGTYSDILQVVGFKDSGNLVLEGQDTSLITTSVDRVAPCHLTNVDLRRNPMLRTANEEEDVKCQICRRSGDGESMLLCDACGHGYHLWCLRPALTTVPDDPTWMCPKCQNAGAQPREWDHQGTIDTTSWTVPRQARAKRQDVQCRALHNAPVAKDFIDPNTNQLRRYKGVAEYCGYGTRPPFRVTYEDGEVHGSTLSEVQAIHQPATGHTAAAVSAVTPAEKAAALPDQFELHTTDGLTHALQQLMPGIWPSGTVTRLRQQMVGGARFLQQPGQPRPGEPECVVTMAEEVTALHQVVNLAQLGQEFFDPFAGTGGIPGALTTLGLRCHTNDINPNHRADQHQDALAPGLYKRVMRSHPIAAVITSPWFAVLDLALPIIAAFTWKASFIHVPSHYVFDAHSRRARFLGRLQGKGQLAVIGGLPRGPLHRRCVWLCVFGTRAVRDRVLGTRPSAGAGVTWSPMHLIASTD